MIMRHSNPWRLDYILPVFLVANGVGIASRCAAP